MELCESAMVGGLGASWGSHENEKERGREGEREREQLSEYFTIRITPNAVAGPH